MQDDDQISVVARSRPKYYFRADATYVIAGGLGGLGKSAAKWMADRKVRKPFAVVQVRCKGESEFDLP